MTDLLHAKRTSIEGKGIVTESPIELFFFNLSSLCLNTRQGCECIYVGIYICVCVPAFTYVQACTQE